MAPSVCIQSRQMRVAMFLLCLVGLVTLGPASARVVSNECVGDSDGNEVAGTVEFPRCEACMKRMVKLRKLFVDSAETSNVTKLTGTIAETVCTAMTNIPYVPYHRINIPIGMMRSWCTEFFDELDDEKLIRFIGDHLDQAQTLCGATGTKDNRTCTGEPTSRRSLLQFVAGQFSHLGQRSGDECTAAASQLSTLLQEKDAQNELKEYSKAACATVWNYWTQSGSDADWCNEGIGRHWDDIHKVLLSVLDICNNLICSQYLTGQACNKQNWTRHVEELHGRFSFHHSDYIRGTHLHKAFSYEAVHRFYDHSVNDHTITCIIIKLGPDICLETMYAAVMSGFYNDVQNRAVKICDFMVDDKMDSCLTQVNNFFEKAVPVSTAVTVYDIMETFFEYGPFQISGCGGPNSEAYTRYKEMSITNKTMLIRDACKYTLSAAKETFADDGLGKELDRITARKVCEVIVDITCDTSLLLNDCESLVETFGSGYYAKLAEYINEDQCASINMNPEDVGKFFGRFGFDYGMMYDDVEH